MTKRVNKLDVYFPRDYHERDEFDSILGSMRKIVKEFPEDKKSYFPIKGYYFEKGIVDEAGLMDITSSSYEIKEGFKFFNDDYTILVNKVKEILTELGLECNIDNYSRIILYLLHYIIRYKQDGPESKDLFNYYREPALLLGHSFYHIPFSLSERPEGIREKLNKIQTIYDLFFKEFEESVSMLLYAKPWFTLMYTSQFYQPSVDVFMGLLLAKWMIVNNPEDSPVIMEKLNSFLEDYLKKPKYRSSDFNTYIKTKWRLIYKDEW